MLVCVAAALTSAPRIAEVALSEAQAVHLEALGLGAFANYLVSRLLFFQNKFRHFFFQSFCFLNGLFSKTPRFSIFKVFNVLLTHLLLLF